MKSVIVVVAWAVAASVGAQSLGELAEKERERRKKNAESGAEVQQFSGQGEQRSQPEEIAGSEPSRERSASPRAGGRGDDPIGDEGRNSGWPELLAKYQERYDQAKRKLEDLQYMQKFCNRSMDGPQGGIPLGTVLGANVPVGDCDALPLEIDRTKSEMARIENECADDARRRGVPPGQARLRR